ncbi:hypothetical protein [Sphingomonas asaccharolytica]|uniref:hypothetical protein n=1 Tax=Sphingomonas asaccharolytica TaxID=40681 RepID=UPI00082A2EEA|nr:hypothetical protein [Sphingomonas asaccharolytica]
MILSLLGLLLAQPGQIMSVPRPEWEIICVAGELGADGKPLCSALSNRFPSFLFERTDTGMRITYYDNCASKRAPDKFVNEPKVEVPLARDASKEAIQKAFNQNSLLLLASFNAFCGRPAPQLSFDQDALAKAVDAVFIRKSGK